MELEKDDILKIEGIVVRLIPKEVTLHIRSSEKYHAEHKAKGGKVIVNEKGIETCVENKTLSLGGLYIVTKELNQDSMIRFQNNYGKGETIELAYADYLAKNENN